MTKTQQLLQELNDFVWYRTDEEDDEMVDKLARHITTQDGKISVLWLALDAIKRAENCWCEHGVGNPMVPEHTKQCRAIQEVMKQ